MVVVLAVDGRFTCRVPHRYGFTCGFPATGPMVTGTVPDFATYRETVPITMVSRYILLGSGSNVNDGKTGYIECEIRGTVRVWQKGWRCRQTTKLPSLTGTVSHKSITS